MIDVFGIAGRLITPVNPRIVATVKVSNGYVVDDNFQAVSQDLRLTADIEVQALSTSDLQHVQNINQQSDLRAVYVFGGIKGLNRPLQTGGDVLTFYGSDWKVVQVLEEWGNAEWSKLVVARQIDQAPRCA